MTDPTTLARQLSFLWLASDWQHDQLVVAATRGLGDRPRWLPEVADHVLNRHRSKPADAPRELADSILLCSAFHDGLDADRAAGRSWRVRELPVVDLDPPEQRMPRPADSVPVIGTESALADLLRVDLPVLLWLADTRDLQRRTPPGPLHSYRYRWIDRGQRTPRLLEIPGPLLRYVQRRLLDRILASVPVHPAAYGFVRGRDAVSNAAAHVGSDWVLSLDLRHFFASVGARQCWAVLRRCGYPEPVVALLTGLVTQRTPLWAIGQMPAGGDADRGDLRAALRTPHLPQGSPSSPAMANLVCARLDRRLAGLAATRDHRYTRYADDLTFSGSGPAPGAGFVALIRRIVVEEGFSPNDAKQRLRTRGRRQQVTGIVINEQTNLPRHEYDRLRAMLHDAVLHGPAVADRDGHPDFRAHLEGRVGWVERLNPVRGARLRRQLAAIDWGQELDDRSTN